MLPDRLPPHSLDAEQAALGAAIISRTAAEGLTELQRDDFYLEAHRKVFDAMLFLLLGEKPVDTMTVPEELKRREQLEAVGGIAYVLALSESVPTAAHAGYYRRIVREKSILRRLIAVCATVSEECHEQPEDLEAFAASVDRRLQAVTAVRSATGAQTLRAEALALAEQLTDALTGEVPPPGTPTGFQTLTDAWGGKGLRFREGHMWVVGGRPSMGKTSLCLQFLMHLARGGYPVLLVSLEMSREQVMERLTTLGTPADVQAALGGKVSGAEFCRISAGLGRIGELPLYVNTTAASVAAVRTDCQDIQRETGSQPVLIVVDYLQRMSGRGENRNQELDYLCREFKTLARDKNSTVILVSQLSRDVEKRENKRPRKSDLRESGGIEAEADVIVFPYRPAYYDTERQEAGPLGVELAEFVVEKHRMGPTGIIPTTWSTSYGGFELIDPHHSDQDAPPPARGDRRAGRDDQ